jgi:hypothetical protein
VYSSDVDLIYVQKRLSDGFSIDDLKLLCFMLEIKHEDIAGETLTAKTRELVIYCHRKGLLPQLLEKSKELNSSIDWTEGYKRVYRNVDLPDEWVEPLQQLFRMTKDFNRNRARPFSDARTAEGDEMAFQMREIAPYVFGQFDISAWLGSTSIGKRLAAIKYLDWAQDVEHFGSLLSMLKQERPFLQFHILLSLDAMLDQLDMGERAVLFAALQAYRGGESDANREYWRKRILSRLADAQ